MPIHRNQKFHGGNQLPSDQKFNDEDIFKSDGQRNTTGQVASTQDGTHRPDQAVMSGAVGSGRVSSLQGRGVVAPNDQVSSGRYQNATPPSASSGNPAPQAFMANQAGAQYGAPVPVPSPYGTQQTGYQHMSAPLTHNTAQHPQQWQGYYQHAAPQFQQQQQQQYQQQYHHQYRHQHYPQQQHPQQQWHYQQTPLQSQQQQPQQYAAYPNPNGYHQATPQPNVGARQGGESDKLRDFNSEITAQLNPVDIENNNASPTQKERPTRLKGNWHWGEPGTRWRWIYPYLYQEPGYVYNAHKEYPSNDYPHKDYAGRLVRAPRSDKFLHPNDGRLRNLYVACTDEIYDGLRNSTWRRTYIHKVAPLRVRMATWIVDGGHDYSSWNGWGVMVMKALPAALAMTFLVWDFRPMQVKRQLYYAPVLYHYRREAKVWSNILENDRLRLPSLARNNMVYRWLRPYQLCVLKDPTNPNKCGYEKRVISIWECKIGKEINLNYLVVAFTAEHFDIKDEVDLEALTYIGEMACRASGIPAFWVSANCIPKNDEESLYRIADILRGAQSMIIAVGKKSTDKSKSDPSTEELLRQWGSRMWTFPEVLLSPGKSIKVYRRDGELQHPLDIPKNQFASRAWDIYDPEVSRHLIDHYLGNITLSRLELASLALKCLYNRKTTQFEMGDQAYALMGLLRLRPQIDTTDTAFQAFSRLSLANDSDLLIERSICTLPLDQEQPWYDMADTYQSELWDIRPYCQIAGVAENDTVIIDGAFGVSVRWKSFYPIYWNTGPSPRRSLAFTLLDYNGFLFFISLALMASAPGKGGFGIVLLFIGFLLFLVFVFFWILTPRLVRRLYSGKFHQTQAEMFAFEGYLNAVTIERAMFGGNYNRLSWSTNSSPLSKAEIKGGEKIGMDPHEDPEVARKIEAAKGAQPGEKRIFTLVDTHNMQLTLFEAVNPPVAFMFCATEGGMQRAIGCSYDWTTQTFYRETVLRLPTTSLDRMDRVPRFRLGLKREFWGASPVSSSV